MADSAPARFWERWLERNWTMLPNATSDDDYDALLAAFDVDLSGATSASPGTTTNLGREDTNASWMYWTKTVVQLLSSSLVGFTVNRCVAISHH